MKNENKHIEFREQVVRYLSGEMPDTDQKLFLESIERDEQKKKLFNEFSTIWNGVDNIASRKRYNLDDEWNLLNGKIDFNDSQKKIIPFTRYLVRIAAVLLIGMAGVAGWLIVRNLNTYEQVAMEQGMEQITLPDGSEVTLNEGSTMKYGMRDQSEQRRVILQGEAYFEVARDTLRPFIIEAGDASIEVLGTSFNVSAYTESETVEVTVTSGLVAMSSKRDKDNMLILNPGNAGVFDKSNKRLELVSEADKNAVAWKTRELYFEETRLSEVVRVISHVYQVDVSLVNDELADCTITVSFSNQDLSAVLQVVAETLDLQITGEGDTFLISGEGCS